MYNIKQHKIKSFVIINGFVHLTQIFANHKHIPLGLFYNDHIIELANSYNNQINYYQIQAITKTYIAVFKTQDLYKSVCKNILFCNYIMQNYKKTLYNYTKSHHILVHPYIKHRFIQFMFFLSQEFGTIYKTQILIRFKISHTQLASILGTSPNTINKLISLYYPYLQIHYCNQQNMCIHNIIYLIQNYSY